MKLVAPWFNRERTEIRIGEDTGRGIRESPTKKSHRGETQVPEILGASHDRDNDGGYGRSQ